MYPIVFIEQVNIIRIEVTNHTLIALSARHPFPALWPDVLVRVSGDGYIGGHVQLPRPDVREGAHTPHRAEGRDASDRRNTFEGCHHRLVSVHPMFVTCPVE